jgi:hypothetical protein
MTLGELRQLTAELPDNTPLLPPLVGHECYKILVGRVTTASPAPRDFDPFSGVRRLMGACGDEQTVVVME